VPDAKPGIDSRWPQQEPALSFGPSGLNSPLLLVPSVGAKIN
jgi:hypothetical protein